MKLIHIENKIDPNEFINVINTTKQDFARELIICLEGKVGYSEIEKVKMVIGYLLRIDSRLL